MTQETYPVIPAILQLPDKSEHEAEFQATPVAGHIVIIPQGTFRIDSVIHDFSDPTNPELKIILKNQ